MEPLLTFVVAGGGFAGVETVAGINDFVRRALHSYPHLSGLRVIVRLSRIVGRVSFISRPRSTRCAKVRSRRTTLSGPSRDEEKAVRFSPAISHSQADWTRNSRPRRADSLSESAKARALISWG